MATPFTVQQARKKLAEMVSTTVGVGPKVYPYNCLNYRTDKDGKPDFSEWPGLFTYGTDGEFIHGWVIKRTGRDSELRNVGCEDFSWFFDIWGYYGFTSELNEETPDVFTSSDDRWDEIVEMVADAFNQNSLIDIAGSHVLHFGLQFPTITVIRAGQQLLHFAGGQIELQYQT